MRELARHALLREVEHDLLGAVDELDRLTGPVEAEPRDVVAGADQPAQRRHLADDARVVRRVRRRRHERRELVHALGAADRVERPGAVELVDDGDRVDRLALRVEREDRLVDVAVALAVEVRGADVGGLGDRPDRQRREHHCAEDRLLGIEILRRDRGGRECLGRRCHQRVVNPPFGLTGRAVGNWPMGAGGGDMQGV